MNKIFKFLLILIIISIGLVLGLHFTGYISNNQAIIPPGSEFEWKQYNEDYNSNPLNKSENSSRDFPLLLNIFEKMKDIPGIENINYEIYVSNNSMQQVINYYQDVLGEKGYSYHEEYSNVGSYENSDIYYHTFIKGLNGVVIYLANYNLKTWICYSTGNVFQYQEIFDYMIQHNIIQ
jgi:hypothetical protein